ncbi:MAG TPA: selenocysteine-specific translation elongation factor [Dehalococcoidia bacterium]
MYVIGTAGHVDHGKSALVQALTGIDPDRWAEEKQRGLTIDLGFAWLQLPGGDEVSIVDVPGHERFIKNMLAGVGGIDLALLVIAADEGVMPQTREHLAIIDLLGIERGVVALTKCDLVDRDGLELARDDATEVLRGTTLANAPIVACSAVAQTGLDDLLEAIEAQLAKTERKRDMGRPRLPIDRSFTMTGFGTVVTGTLVDGALRVGEEVEALPDGPQARVRGLQTHGQMVEVAPPGRRTAVNLTGVAPADLHRGMVLTHQGALQTTKSVDIRLRAVPYLTRPVRHNLTVTFHTGAAEVEGRLLLLDAAEVPPGGEAWAQIRLAAPVCALKGDRFVIRDPNDTLGGGLIVDTDAPRHRRFDADAIARLEALARGSPEELLLAAIALAEPATVGVVAGDDEARTALDRLVEAGDVVALTEGALTKNSALYTRAGLSSAIEAVNETLAAYHAATPLRPGMPREELRSRLRLEPKAFDELVARLVRDEVVAEHGSAVGLASHSPALTPQQEATATTFLAALRETPFSPPTDRAPEGDVLAYLEGAGEVVRANDVIFAAEAYSELVERIQTHLRTQKTITLAQVRDMFGTSRKYAQALLEHLDAKHITRRVGDVRVLA